MNQSKEIVAQYILEQRGSGHCLPYVDYGYIDQWIRLCPDVDRLLLVLDDIVPRFFSENNDGPVKTLAGVNKQVSKKLQLIREDMAGKSGEVLR